jgi:hypothetical protein
MQAATQASLKAKMSALLNKPKPTQLAQTNQLLESFSGISGKLASLMDL